MFAGWSSLLVVESLPYQLMTNLPFGPPVTSGNVFVVAGGSHPTHAYWLQGTGVKVAGRVIRVPETFDRLLAAADRDLGCGSDECRIQP